MAFEIVKITYLLTFTYYSHTHL